MWFEFAVMIECSHVVVGIGLVGGADRGWFEVTGQSVRVIAIMEADGINGNGTKVIDGRRIGRRGGVSWDTDLDDTESGKAVGKLIRRFEGEVSGGRVGVTTDGVGFGGCRETDGRLTGGDANPWSGRHGEAMERGKVGRGRGRCKQHECEKVSGARE